MAMEGAMHGSGTALGGYNLGKRRYMQIQLKIDRASHITTHHKPTTSTRRPPQCHTKIARCAIN
jgi:hypothetical protein